MAKKDFLHETHALQIVTELSNQQIEFIYNNQDRDVAYRLGKLRDAMWGKVSVGYGDIIKIEAPLSLEQREKIFAESFEGLNKEQQNLLIDSYAKMGHLYEISAISARSNYFDKIKKDPRERAVDFGGVDDFIYKDEDKNKNPANQIKLDEWIKKLNKPIFEMVFTAHPTNVNGLESMRAQREICKAMETGDKEAIKAAVAEYQKAPLLNKDGKNLTVRDETENTLYFLGNIYEDLDKAYKRYDDPLAKKAGKEGVEYDPTKLDLKIRLGAWGSSGDKDGNKNVTAETTLEAIALHTQAALTHYSEDLAKLNSPSLGAWNTLLSEKKVALEKLLPEIEGLRKNSVAAMNGKMLDDGSAPMSSQDLSNNFDELSKQLANIRDGLDAKKFTDDIQAAYTQNKDQETLNLLRRARIFGFNFGKIEYRETAEQYERVVEELISKQLPNYTSLEPEEKATALTRLLQDNDNVAAKSLANMKQEIVERGAGKAYSDEKYKDGKNKGKYVEGSALPIAYHSIKRMELARDFPDIIKDNVLAECGSLDLKDDQGNKIEPTETQAAAQGVANLLEAQFLQRAVEKVEKKDGKEIVKRAVLGIVPLFEEPDTMKYIDKIMGAAYDNPAYNDQLKLLQGDDKQRTQQVQIAHSDNARRSGLQAARAYIHEAHKKMAKVNKEHEVNTQFFEGGSVSDAYRNGVRAISANVESFGLYDFAKMTFQGGDLLNYFNHPDSTSRLFYRQISHQSSGLEEMPNGEWRTAPAVQNQNNIMDEVAISALKSMLKDYQDNDFTQNNMGSLLGVLGYKKEVSDSNSSSRGERSIVANIADTVQSSIKKIVAVAIDSVRTIGFSKTWQNNAIVPSWIGSLTLRDALEKYTQEKYEELASNPAPTSEQQDFEDLVKDAKAIGVDGKVHLTPQLLRAFYVNSNTFRDAQDRSAFALALSDMNAADKIIGRKLQNADLNDPDSVINKANAEKYLIRVKDTFEAAASLAYEAITGEKFSVTEQEAGKKNNEIEAQITKALPNLNGELARKKNYSDFIMYLRSEKPEIFEDPNLARTIICAGDTVNHGRWIGASDNTYIQSRMPNKERSVA